MHSYNTRNLLSLENMQEFWKLDFDKTTYSYNYTTTTGSSTLDKLHKILTIVLFAVDGAGVVLNVVVFFVLLQVQYA